MNHAAHKAFSGGNPGDPWDLNGDGRLSLFEANSWYRIGNGESITVDAASVDLDFIDPKSLSDKPEVRQTLFKSRDGRVFGNITIQKVGYNKVKILSDNYGFEMHKGSGIKTRVRNFLTKIGLRYAGKGKDFDIHFRGTNTINNVVERFQRFGE